MKEKVTILTFETFPSLPDSATFDIIKALKLKKRGLAVTLLLQELRKQRVEFNNTERNDLISKEFNQVNLPEDKGSLVAGSMIDILLKDHRESINKIQILYCCECKDTFIPRNSSIGTLFSFDDGKNIHFACRECIKKGQENVKDISPPPYEEWPGWAKEAFGKRDVGVEFNW